jgi:hypothetical protein
LLGTLHEIADGIDETDGVLLRGDGSLHGGIPEPQRGKKNPTAQSARWDYSYTVAFGHILLTTSGTIIVALMT